MNKQQPKQKAQPKREPRKRATAPQKKKRTQPKVVASSIATLSQHHCPIFSPENISHIACTPVVERLSFVVNNDATNYVSGLVGPYTFDTNGQENLLRSGLLDVLCVYGFGTGVPVTGGTRIKTVQMGGYTSGVVATRINRLKMTIVNTGSGTAYPSGLLFAGTLDSPVDVSDFLTFSALSNFLTGRKQMHDFTAFSLMDRREGFVSYPLDMVEYESFNNILSGGTSAVNLTDALAPMAFVIPPNAVISSYLVTLHVEWVALFKDDGILQSTHRKLPSLPSKKLREAANHASLSSGYLGKIEHEVESVGKAALRASRNPVARAVASVV